MGLIWFLIFGLIVGLVARALMPGRQKMNLLFTTLLGCAGALVGGFLGNLVAGREATGPTTAGFLGSLVGAFLILLALTAFGRRRRTPSF